jgi:hypothetical protein
MVGCDCEWNFPDDKVLEASAAPFRPNILPPAAADDDAAQPAPPAAAAATAVINQHDFTKWDVLDANLIPIVTQSYDAADISAHHSVHAELVLFFLSDEIERAYSAGPSASCSRRNVPGVAPPPLLHRFPSHRRRLRERRSAAN